MIIQQVANLPNDFWSKLARGSNATIYFWVKEDCRQGIMQNGTRNHQYSETYAKYKANDMKRFTTGEATNYAYNTGGIVTKDLYFKNKKTKYGTGDRLSGYKGISLESTDVSKVTMILTGLTTNSLKEKTHTRNSLTMVFEGVNPDILLGNKERGYDIIGLNDTNREKVRQRILNEYKKNVSKLPKKITIDLR